MQIKSTIIRGYYRSGAPLLLVEAPKFQEFVYSINYWYHNSKLVKIKDTLGKSQTSIVILRDLEESLTQIDIEKVNAVITVGAANYVLGDMLKHIYMKTAISSDVKIVAFFQKSIHAIQYIRARSSDNTFRFTFSTFTRWNPFFSSLQQLQSKEQYLKGIAYEMESRIDKSNILILKNNEFWNHLRIIIHTLKPYSLTSIILKSQHATLADAVHLWARTQMNIIDDIIFDLILIHVFNIDGSNV
ncbi:hypothetical protein F8M41_023496 [Gigaspora margarita]|uniref:Uncharacterized protein n=1 Tax=Gigaspora margarita TaxID=4874 RepID=A0A8H4EHD9_GIGMA|nr:hypothetical protein F8M41_023496 [Gigaspora margarita]